MIHGRWIQAFFVCFCLSLYAGAARSARIEPLYTPLPLDVGRGFTLSELREAISDSLINSGWRKQRSQGNEIRAYHAKGRHTGTIGISYTGRLIKFHYLGSDGLNATEIDGVEYIHGLYNGWVHDLENALKFRVNQLALEHDRYGGKAPVTEVEIHPGRRRSVMVKRQPGPEVQEIKPERESAPMEQVVEPVEEPALEQEAVVHDVIVKPEAGGKPPATAVVTEPGRTPPTGSVGKQAAGGRAVQLPKQPAARELPPVDDGPARSSKDPADTKPGNKDLGELKW